MFSWMCNFPINHHVCCWMDGWLARLLHFHASIGALVFLVGIAVKIRGRLLSGISGENGKKHFQETFI